MTYLAADDGPPYQDVPHCFQHGRSIGVGVDAGTGAIQRWLLVKSLAWDRREDIAVHPMLPCREKSRQDRTWEVN
jgi:hypothetical protein